MFEKFFFVKTVTYFFVSLGKKNDDQVVFRNWNRIAKVYKLNWKKFRLKYLPMVGSQKRNVCFVFEFLLNENFPRQIFFFMSVIIFFSCYLLFFNWQNFFSCLIFIGDAERQDLKCGQDWTVKVKTGWGKSFGFVDVLSYSRLWFKGKI